MRQDIRKWTTTVTLAVAILFTLAIVANPSAQAQTFNVIYTFTGHDNAANPVAGLAIDRAGNLYGTSAWGGNYGHGTVFELKHTNSGFVFSQLYNFAGGTDGAFPLARVTIGPNGTLYGTTYIGGSTTYCQGAGCGTVFNLRPPARVCVTVLCPWDETVLYSFTKGKDGGNPWAGVVFDQSGDLYGATANGGSAADGVVYELTPSNGGWTDQVLYTFTAGQDGGNPLATMIFDNSGNLYGTANIGGLPGCGGFGCGTVYQLAPSGSGWAEHTLYQFQNGSDGASPQAGLIIDSSGNLYGATPCCGTGSGGTVFELTSSGGNWTFNLAYGLSGDFGPGPWENLVRDNAGNLYGTTVNDGIYGQGSVFKLTPTDGGWTYTSLHDFTGGADGGSAEGGLLIDSNGNLYGTTYEGGASGCGFCGVVYEITP